MSIDTIIQSAHEAGVELRFINGRVKAAGPRGAVTRLIEPLRQHRADLIRWFTQTSANDHEPPADPAAWRELSSAYYSHHWTCRTCCAAGQGRGLRCGVGASLWSSYASSVPTPGTAHT